ncbi:aldo/keto reductase [Nocardia acidivorans]|uniref:aldo/keto reductase n=1 Tax=Nocardia acidivorans TaxID=404580 RepID=UPI00082E5862|nr:aldo/keto reductase [Nocardia acidivorans]
MTAFELNDARRIPAVGFGTYQLRPGRITKSAVSGALAAGYRHIDTATIYGNEQDVGAAIRESGIAREDIWVTTKLWNGDHGDPLKALETSLTKLGLDHVDLWLMHWPTAQRLKSWDTMVRARDERLATSIGVSNFLVPHLTELAQHSEVTPAVDQIELSPFLLGTRADTVRYCRDRGIAIEAYSPLTQGARLRHPVLVRIADGLGVSTAQVLLRWCLQHGFITLPRSSNPDRIRANLELDGFALSPADMRELDDLDEGLTTGWDPSTAS